MRINKLTVENFRCFKHQEFPFSPRFNVLAGDNGTGKTAVLEAIAVGTGAFLQEFVTSPSHARPFQPRDAHVVNHRFNQEVTAERQFPVVVRCEGEIDGHSYNWDRVWKSARGRGTGQPKTEIASFASDLSYQVMTGQSATLPLLAYYGTGRLWAQKRSESESLKELTEILPVTSRFAGYDSALNRTSNDKKLFEWIKTQKLISLEEKEPSQSFECVKSAIASCLESHGWDELDYRVREDALVVIKHNQSADEVDRLPFDYLSDGYRNTIAMVADIARRAVLLNPQFGSEAAQSTPGIVLIDEIDLHLHPKWQRTVVGDLRRAFPKIQFFATSHSPFIIQSLEPGELLDLNPDENMPCPDAEYSDESIEEIAAHVMDTPGPRSARIEELNDVAKEYYRLLDEGQNASVEEVKQIKRRLDKLAAPYSKNVAYYAFLEMKREAAGLGHGE